MWPPVAALTAAGQYDWDAVFSGAQWLHLSGITPALSEVAAEATLMAAQKAKAAGCQVSIDLNYRGKLWKWGAPKGPKELCRETMAKILPYVDVVVGNEEDCDDVLSIKAGDTDVHSGTLDTAGYVEVARKVVEKFPNISKVAITLRESISATHNNWGAMLFDKASDAPFLAPCDAEGVYKPYAITSIVDRVGGGDSFAAGLIFALTTPELADPALAIRYAVAASCLVSCTRARSHAHTLARAHS